MQDFVSAFGSKQPVQGRRQEGDLEAGESTRGRVTGRCAPFRGGAKQGAFLRRVYREARDLQAGLAFRDDGPFAEGITGLGRHCPARPAGRVGKGDLVALPLQPPAVTCGGAGRGGGSLWHQTDCVSSQRRDFGGLKQQKFPSQFWGLDVQNRGLRRRSAPTGGSEGGRARCPTPGSRHSPAALGLWVHRPHACPHPRMAATPPPRVCVCVRISSSHKDTTGHGGWRPLRRPHFNLTTDFRNPISK